MLLEADRGERVKEKNIDIIMVVVFIAIIVLLPTPHIRTVEDFVALIDCQRVLTDGESFQENLTDMLDETRIVINITSSDDVHVLITGTNGSQTFIVYNYTTTSHTAQRTRDYRSYNITVLNPTGVGRGATSVNGSITVFHVHDVEEWLPWWMP